MEGGKDHEQKKGMRKKQVFSTMERIYSGRRHMREQGKFEEHHGVSRRI